MRRQIPAIAARCHRMVRSVVCIMAVNLFVQPPFAMCQKTPKKADPALEELRQLGKKIADAVLAKDISALLNYDRADLRSKDGDALQDQKSELYCYLFDSKCISWRKQPSIYERISQAKPLAIHVIDGGKSPANGVRYAFLIFFDRSAVSEKMLRSPELLCEKSADQIAVWSFKMNGNGWEAAKPFFDFGTDSLCPPE